MTFYDYFQKYVSTLTLEASREGGERGGYELEPPSIFLALNFCCLTNCQKLTYICSLHIFWHLLGEVTTDNIIIICHTILMLTAKVQLFAKNWLKTDSFTVDSNYFVDLTLYLRWYFSTPSFSGGGVL